MRFAFIEFDSEEAAEMVSTFLNGSAIFLFELYLIKAIFINM